MVVRDVGDYAFPTDGVPTPGRRAALGSTVGQGPCGSAEALRALTGMTSGVAARPQQRIQRLLSPEIVVSGPEVLCHFVKEV